jgi:tetratricopeptide (TPR) repeat protein
MTMKKDVVSLFKQTVASMFIKTLICPFIGQEKSLRLCRSGWVHWFMLPVAFCFLFSFSEMALGQNKTIEKQDGDPLILIDHYIQLSSNYINRNLDSAIYFGEQAHALIEEHDSDSAKAVVYLNLGSVYRANGNHAISLDYYFKSLSLLDKILAEYPSNMNIIYIKSDLMDLMGINYFYQSNYDKALEYYEQSLALMDFVKQNAPHIYDEYHKFKLFNNIAGVYIRKENYDRAIEYYKTSIDLLGDDNKGLVASSLFNNIGICYMEKFEFESAFHYIQKALEIRQSEGDTRSIAQCYNNLGKNYFYQQNYREAERYAKMALKLGREIGNPESIRISLKALTDIYDSIGDVSQAYDAFREYKNISDSIFNAENIARISQLEVRHEFEQQQRIFDVEIKRREAEEQKRKIIYLSIAGVLFFSLLTAILLIFLQRSKIKHSKLEKELLELEHKHLSLEKEKLKEQLDFKNRELTTNVMYLLKKNELITSISEKLIRTKLEFKKENQKIIQEIINELRSGQDNDTWAEFEAYFTQVHTDFYKRLNEKFPNLSANERKLCAFLRLNMSTKDIAAITYQSVNSITVARSRLKKKLNIEDDEMSLVNYLAQF